MAVTLTGSGGLYTKLGHLIAAVDDLNALRGGSAQATARVLSTSAMITRTATLEADYAAGTAQYPIIDGFASVWANVAGTGALQGAFTSFTQTLQTLASNTVIDMANTDTPLASKTLAAAWQLIAAQMVTNSNTLNASTVAAGAQTSVGSPVGNPVIVMSVKDVYGRALQYALPETLTFLTTQDANGGATANQEQVTVTGQNPQGDPLFYNWSTSLFGSGAAAAVSLIDASQNNSAGNLLQNSEFATATTANVMDNWTITVGTAGTTVFQAGSGYLDSSSLQFTGDGGGTLSAVTQTFNQTPATGVGAGGTAGTLTPDSQYAVNFWVKCSATPAAGTLVVDLIDGSGNVIADDATTNNTITKSLTAVSTSWVNVTGVFRTPANLTATQKLRVRLSVAIDNGKSVYIDRLGFGGQGTGSTMTQLYAGGPSFAMFSGSTKTIASGTVPDSWTVAITNTWGTLQKGCQRLFNLTGLGIYLNNSGSPSIADSLIT